MTVPPPPTVLPYMGYVGKCCCEGYGFRAVYSSIGNINQRFGTRIGHHFSRNLGNEDLLLKNKKNI